MKQITPPSNVLLFRGSHRRKRIKKQKGKVVDFPVKPKREVGSFPLILERKGIRYKLGDLPDDKINELCAFLRTINSGLYHSADSLENDSNAS